MKTQTHTLGPWKIETKGSKHFIDGGDGFTVTYLDRMTDIRGRDECELNARLIAAAPDLLAALKELLSDKYLANPINDDRMSRTRAALAKAQGNQ